ncbi:MAG: putative alpha-1,2-mannosidase [Myxococcota bacterium]|jgi:predicted alpha-1,2-mannosidase
MLLLLISCKADPVLSDEPVDLIDYIDPFIGTGGIAYGVGGSYPGAGRPFSLVKVSPDTGDSYGSAPGFSHTGGYHYDDDYIQGFSHMHMQGVGIASYGNLSLMPADGVVATDQDGYAAQFSHDDEDAGAGWYTVSFAQPAVDVTLTATDHTALHRYVFGDAVEDPTVLIDLAHVLGSGVVPGGEIRLLPDQRAVEGWLLSDPEMGSPFPLFFAMVFDQDPSDFGVWVEGAREEGGLTAELVLPEGWEEKAPWKDGEKYQLGGWMSFDGAQEVRVRVAISNVDIAGAWSNLGAEHHDFDLEVGIALAESAWADFLSPVTVWGGSEYDRTVFATSLYKATQMPTLFSDVDGRYRGFDDEIHTADWGGYYTDFSLWDTYRTAHPLYTLLWPDHHADMLDSLAAMARDGGSIPRWPLANWDGGAMLGTPGNIVFAEAYLKGVTDFDVDTLRAVAWEIAAGEVDPEYGGRPSVETYDTYGYHPVEEVTGRSVAWTQELAISDFALGTLEDTLGDPARSAYLLQRSGFWINHYNPETGYFHARTMDGEFVEIDSEGAWDDAYTEGNARQYRWLVPHDPEGLSEAMGGDDVVISRLDELFAENLIAVEEAEGMIGTPSSWYWHGNEPGLHTAWLYSAVGRPDLAQKWLRWIMDNEYSEAPDGIDGNDDGGTLAAWYVFAAMGFYPLAGTDRYLLSEPAFDAISLDIGGEDPLEITRTDVIDRVYLDGVELESFQLTHDQIADGAQLGFYGK